MSTRPPDRLPADEPVFILHASDPAAAWSVRNYADRLRSLGGDPERVRFALDQADRMQAWADAQRARKAAEATA